jgi:hypothetical protein
MTNCASCGEELHVDDPTITLCHDCTVEHAEYYDLI